MEKSRYWTTNNTGDGPTAGYTADDFADLMRRLLTTDQEATEGVLRGVDNELAVSGASNPVAVASGAAMVYGHLYENSASLNLAVASPLTGTTGGRINLKADWSAQTVRAVVQLNTDGDPAIPALVQTPGSAWSIPLATFTVTTGGVIALTDARVFCHFATQLTPDMIDALAGYSVVGRTTAGSGAAGAITAADNTVLRVSGGALGFGTVSGAMLADGAVSTAKLAADSVDDTKLGSRVPQFYRRQGNSASDWSSPGTTNYTPGAVRMESGVATVTIADGSSSGTVAITFPTAFADKPLILLTINNDFSVSMTPIALSQATTGFTLRVARTSTGGSSNIAVAWLAIGPE